MSGALCRALAIKRVLIANKLPGRNLVMCLECTHTHVSEINWVGGVTLDCILYSKLCRGSLHGRYRQTNRQTGRVYFAVFLCASWVTKQKLVSEIMSVVHDDGFPAAGARC